MLPRDDEGQVTGRVIAQKSRTAEGPPLLVHSCDAHYMWKYGHQQVIGQLRCDAGSLKQVALECSPFFCFHHVNAFEDASGNVTLDCIAMHGGVDFTMNFGNLSHEFFTKQPWRTALTRLSLNPNTYAVRACSADICSPPPCTATCVVACSQCAESLAVLAHLLSATFRCDGNGSHMFSLES